MCYFVFYVFQTFVILRKILKRNRISLDIIYDSEIAIDFCRIISTSIYPPVSFFEERSHFGKWENNRCGSTNEFHSIGEILGNHFFVRGIFLCIRFGEFLTVSGVTDDEHIGAVAVRSWRRKSTRLQRSKRGDVGSYLVVAAACSTDFERLAVPCTRREESRLIRPFTLQAFLLLPNFPTAALSKRPQLLPSFKIREILLRN